MVKTSISKSNIICDTHFQLEKSKIKQFLKLKKISHIFPDKNKAKRIQLVKTKFAKFSSKDWRLDQTITCDKCWFYRRKKWENVSNALWKKGKSPDTINRRDGSEKKAYSAYSLVSRIFIFYIFLCSLCE